MGSKNTKKPGFVTCYVIFFFLLLARGEAVLPLKKGTCTYAITVETTCTKGAETSSHISLRFGDTRSNGILVRHLNTKFTGQTDPLQPDRITDSDTDNVATTPFQACTVDEFRVTAQCIESPICYLYLKLVGKDNWRPGFARVDVLERPELSSDRFYFRRYLPRRVWHGSDACDVEVTPFGIEHKKKMFSKEQIV